MAKTNHSKRSGSCGGSCSPVFRSRRSVCGSLAWLLQSTHQLCMPYAGSHTRINAPQSMLHWGCPLRVSVCGCGCGCPCLCGPTSFWQDRKQDAVNVTIRHNRCLSYEASHLTWQFVCGCININFHLQFIFRAAQ